MQFTLNGETRTYSGDPNRSLLKHLREDLHITSMKDGCSGQGACGCCTIQLNDKAVLSCIVPMSKVDGGEVFTIEGIGEYRQEVFANAFVLKGGVQCGYCIPGFVMQAHVLLNNNPNPTRDEVEHAVTLNLCRCTGYKKIVDSILFAAEAIRENKRIELPPNDGKIGSRLPKYDAKRLVLGQRPFVGDMFLDGMLFGALKFSDHPRAKFLGIDTSEAEKLPGVHRVFTARDIPGERYTGLIVQDWPVMVDIGEVTRYLGDVLAGIVADSEEIAREAVDLIKVDYEVLTPITDPKEALKPDAPKIHPKGNLLSETIIDRGDVDGILANSAFVSTGTYFTQRIEHAFMEFECCVARPLNKGVEVFSQGQGVYEDQKSLAKILNLPLDDVKVVLVPNGGGFGGKEDLSVQGHAALYAWLMQKPVKVKLTRDESITMHPKRHPMELEYTLGCDKDGQLTALKARIIGDTGAYASVGMKVLERAAGHATGAYHVPAVDLISRAVYTNNVPCGAMRGFGVNQSAFALESCIDDLCEQGGFDRWQFRYDNALVPGRLTSTGQKVNEGAGVRACLDAVKEHFYNAKYAGIACGIKNTGIGNGMPDIGRAKIEIVAPDHIIIHHGWTEMGQGVYTVAVQYLCELTGIDPNIIEVKVDTSMKVETGMTTASRGTSLLGNAVLDAGGKLAAALKERSLSELVGEIFEGCWICDWTTAIEDRDKEPVTHYSYGYAAQVVVLDEKGKISTVYAAHDAGRIVNPMLYEGQIEGSVHMGLGYALTEELVLIDGVPETTNLRKMGIIRAKKTPNIVVIGVEVTDPNGPLGAKGVGEIGLVPTAPAVANALYQFDGVRRNRLPMKDAKAL